MNQKQREKLFDICRRSKLGHHVSKAEHAFAGRMWRKFEKEYCEISKQADKKAVAEYLGPFRG